MKHVITALVENHPGVLARIVGLISGRGFNIDSLNVAATQDATVSRLTLTVEGDDRDLEQVTKQLNKQVDVLKVADMTRTRFINRELVMIEVNATAAKRREIVELAQLFGAKVIGVRDKRVVVQVTEEQDKINDLLELLRPFGILDISRSGVVAMGCTE